MAAADEALALGFRGNLSGATDAEIFRFAVYKADTEAAIAGVVAKMKALRAESRAALVEAQAAKAATQQAISYKFSLKGLQLKDAGATVMLGRGGFNVGGGIMRSATGATLVPIVASAAIRRVAKEIAQFQEEADKYGAREAVTRRGASANRLFTAPGRYIYDLGTNLTADLARDLGGMNAAEIAEYRERAMDFRQSLMFTLLNPLAGGYFERTSFEKEEIEAEAKKAHEKFVQAEREYLDTWQPPGYQLATDADVAALKKKMWAMNGAAFQEVVREDRAQQRVDAYARAGED